MTIKVVQGLIGSNRPDVASKSAQPHSAANVANTSATSATVKSTEAAVTNLKSARGGAPQSEKIKDIKEARQVASDVADQISADESSVEAHGELSASAAGEHL